MFNKPTRNHFTIIFERLGILLFASLAMGLSSLQNSIDKMFSLDFWRSLLRQVGQQGTLSLLSGFAFVLIFCISFFISFRHWQKTFFYIDGDYFVFERRTLFKKTSKLHLSQIASVNLQRTFFERLVGTCKVKFDLNSSHTANRTDFALVLPLQQAQTLREELSCKPAADAASESAVNNQSDGIKRVFTFTGGEVLRHKILSIPVLQSLIGFAALIGAMAGEGESSPLQNPRAFLGLMLFAVIGYIFHFIRSTLNLLDYRVEWDGENFRINYGLIKNNTFVFASSKINAVFVKQPFLARLFGLYYVEVAVVGLGNEKAESPLICLLAKRERVKEILELCGADFYCSAGDIRSHKAALVSGGFYALVSAGIGFIILQLSYLPFTLPVTAAIFISALPGVFLSYKVKTVAYDEHVFHYTKGIFSKTRAMFKYGDIQDANFRSNFMFFKKRVARMTFHILSGSNIKKHRTGYFSLTDLESAAENILKNKDSSAGLLE
ncbi:MAG: PH domain-containing protein [Acutalibacteraceae bacterium]|jgi:uncharacterized membrane protein YdbT with pleckstrin-like domain